MFEDMTTATLDSEKKMCSRSKVTLISSHGQQLRICFYLEIRNDIEKNNLLTKEKPIRNIF